MRFTRDICRLLGLGGGLPGGEQMEVQDGGDRRKDRSQTQVERKAVLSGEEGLDEEEKTRRRAERRRAKRKRQKERKKLERREQVEDVSEQDEDVVAAALESDREEKMKEEEEVEKKEWIAVGPRNRSGPESVPAAPLTAQNRSNRPLTDRNQEEEPEWDISSAFVANAASNMKLKGPKSRTTHLSREDKENESRSSQMESTEEMKRRGESLTVQGIEMFQRGQYTQAVDMFTEAIHCDPNDHRFYGNRSYCYWCLEQYPAALTDAHRSIQLAPDWPKGFFRKGCALMGLKQYSEAEKAMEEVLQLDQCCKEASSKLFTCRMLQLKAMGFKEEQSKHLLDKFTTIQAAITSPEAAALKKWSQQDQTGSCCSLWVGNVTVEVTEQDLWDLFKMFGEIESIRVLHERFCAFVNFKNANMAAKALDKLQGVELRGSKLVMRYPDRWVQRSPAVITRTNSHVGSNVIGPAAAGSRRKLPMLGDECFYWRTTGCFHADKCRFRHVPDQQGRDMKP